MADEREWNPRFVFYAKVHGRTPEKQLEHDKKEYPGGCLTGFSCWIREQWGLYATTCRWILCCGERVPETSIEGFSKWMKKRYPTVGIDW